MSQSLNKCMDNVINIYWSIMLPLFLPVLQVTFGILLPSLARYHRWTSSLMLVCLRDWIGRPLPWIAWVADHCHIWWTLLLWEHWGYLSSGPMASPCPCMSRAVQIHHKGGSFVVLRKPTSSCETLPKNVRVQICIVWYNSRAESN